MSAALFFSIKSRLLKPVDLTSSTKPSEGKSLTNIVLLNNVDHADLLVAPGYGAAFGDAVNQTRVFAPEFEALQREYPILFRQDASGTYFSVALLGLDRDENLFLDHDEWRARYVPAAHRRGPFSIGVQAGRPPGAEREPMINVDLDHPRVTMKIGERIFRRHGGSSQFLEEASRALGVVFDGLEREASMFSAFEEAGLLEPVTIDITVGEGRRYDIEDVHALSREKLNALDGAALERLNRAGWLAAAFHTVSSLANIERIIALKASKGAHA